MRVATAARGQARPVVSRNTFYFDKKYAFVASGNFRVEHGFVFFAILVGENMSVTHFLPQHLWFKRPLHTLSFSCARSAQRISVGISWMNQGVLGENRKRCHVSLTLGTRSITFDLLFLDSKKEDSENIALLVLFRTTRITLHCPIHGSSLSNYC